MFRHWKKFVLPLIATLGLSACSTPPRKPAVPLALTDKAEISGLPNVRHIVRGDMPELFQEGFDSVVREKAFLASQNPAGP